MMATRSVPLQRMLNPITKQKNYVSGERSKTKMMRQMFVVLRSRHEVLPRQCLTKVMINDLTTGYGSDQNQIISHLLDIIPSMKALCLLPMITGQLANKLPIRMYIGNVWIQVLTGGDHAVIYR